MGYADYRHPEVLAVFGEPRRMGHKRKRPSFETPRKRAAPQDDGGTCGKNVIARSQRVRPLAGPMINSATKQSSHAFVASGLLRFARNDANIHILSGMTAVRAGCHSPS
jgi:hypothetical protein